MTAIIVADRPQVDEFSATTRAHGDVAPTDELRIALSMRGGVSLAVWIGGAVLELDRLTRPPAHDEGKTTLDHFYSTLLEMGGYGRAVLDVITGTSAGGLNGVVLAASRAYGFDFGEMLRVWVELGDIERLTRDPKVKLCAREQREDDDRPASILKGDDYFLRHLHEELVRLIGHGRSSRAVSDPFDLILTATLVDPSVHTTIEDPFAPLPEIRRAANFHFRFMGEPGTDGGDFQEAERAHADDCGSTAALLALAGRATSSFPVAFEPASIPHAAAAIFSDPPSARGAKKHVIDGGVLDNIPVVKALEAISTAPVVAHPDRWLVFLHPSPQKCERTSSEPISLAEPRALRTMLITAKAAFTQETLLDDLAELNRHNSRAREQRIRRTALMADVRNPCDLADVAMRSMCAAREMRSRLDAIRAVRVIAGEQHVRRPLGACAAPTTRVWLDKQPDHLLEDIAKAYEHALDEMKTREGVPAVVATPAGLRVACDVVTGWLLSQPAGDAVSARCERLATLRRLTALAQEWSDQTWLVAAAQGPDPAQDWTARATRVAIGTLRGAPEKQASALKHTLSLGEDERGGLTRRTRDVAAKVADLDDRVRAQIEAMEPTDDASADLAIWILDELVHLLEPLSTSGQPADSPLTTADSSEERRVRRINQLLEKGREHLRATFINIVVVLTCAQTVEFACDDDVSFVRVSGGNTTPLEQYLSDDGTSLGVHEKLSGNQLWNFAGFWSAKWRANDWMWGRMDAVKSIVDLTIRPERLRRSILQPEDIVRHVRTIAVDAGMSVPPDDLQRLRVDVQAAKIGDGITDTLSGMRSILTEAMQRQIFAELYPRIHALSEAPEWRPLKTDPLPKQDVPTKMKGYRVGSETFSDLDPRRRTQLGMRLAMVTYNAARPVPRGLLPRLVAWTMTALKPLILFTAFATLNFSRALFVANAIAVGFWLGPSRYRSHPTTMIEPGRWGHELDDLVVHERGRAWWHEQIAPHSAGEWIGFALIALLSIISGALQVQRGTRLRSTRRRRGPTHSADARWLLASVLIGCGGLVIGACFGICIGPPLVVCGAGFIACIASWWMRRRARLLVTVATVATYVIVAAGGWGIAGASIQERDQLVDVTLAERWYGYTGWLSIVAFCAVISFIVALCTYTRVLPNPVEHGMSQAERSDA